MQSLIAQLWQWLIFLVAAAVGLWLLRFVLERLQQRFGQAPLPYAFLTLNMLVFGLFTFWPLLMNGWISLSDTNASILPRDWDWAGASNYSALFDCPDWRRPERCAVPANSFIRGLINTFIFVVIQVPLMLVVSTVTALILSRDIALRGFWRAVFFYPVMLSPVVVGIIWTWVLQRRGILNNLLSDLSDLSRWLADIPLIGLGIALLLAALVGMLLLVLRSAFVAQVGRPYSAHWFVGSLLLLTPLFWLLFDWPALLQSAPYLPIREARQIEGARAYVDWLTQPDSSWPMLWTILVYTWAHMGFYMLIILAGLQAIPKDLYEAARMDGTRPARIFGRITLPLLMPTLFVVLILSLIKGFQIFDEVFVLTGGGPGNATLMVVQHIYQLAFGGVRKFYDSAAASSLVMAGFILAFTLMQIALNRRQFSGTRS